MTTAAPRSSLRCDDITGVNQRASDLIDSRSGSSSLVWTSESPSPVISSSETSSVDVLVSSESLSSESGGQR